VFPADELERMADDAVLVRVPGMRWGVLQQARWYEPL
jgi:hypothetical protein